MGYLSQNLDELREKNSANKSRNPFPHQIEAFQALNNTFNIPSKNYAGGLLVLPTGAGKTFTAVNWLCRNILSKKIKILWFAQSSYLLNQACMSFYENAIEIPFSRKFLNISVPAEIIDELSNDAPRNDYIIDDYCKNKEKYGKTIIFADTWPQCVYMVRKLKDRGIKAEFVFSKIDANPGSPEARNRRKSTDNERIIKEFKEGKHQVLVNIRMLTEGVDIPDVKTVFLTRQTTSSILMTQMIGRALRGIKAGGGKNKSEANIVMFIDNWKGLIDVFIDPTKGKTEDTRTPTTSAPFRIIPIILVEILSKHIEGGTIPKFPFSEYIPVGWYQTEIVRNVKDDPNDPKEEMQTFFEFVMVYNKTRDRMKNFIDNNINKIPEHWSDEKLDDQTIIPKVNSWINEYFDPNEDLIGSNLRYDLIKICRHIAIHGAAPEYYEFVDRERFDLGRLANLLRSQTKQQQLYSLKNEYESPGNLWRVFYKNFHMFITAFDLELTRIILEEMDPNSNGKYLSAPNMLENKVDIELTEEEKKQIKKRDNNICLCCYRSGKDVILQIDHIVPIFQGGRADVENSQTLCKECNMQKGKNAINFRINCSPCSSPKNFHPYPLKGNESQIHALSRTVNMFYHCQALSEIDFSLRRNGKHYSTWEIVLYQGNDPELLIVHKSELMKYIQNDLGCSHVKHVNITSVK